MNEGDIWSVDSSLTLPCMWIFIIAGGFECNVNQFLLRCSSAAAVFR